MPGMLTVDSAPARWYAEHPAGLLSVYVLVTSRWRDLMARIPRQTSRPDR